MHLKQSAWVSNGICISFEYKMKKYSLYVWLLWLIFEPICACYNPDAWLCRLWTAQHKLKGKHISSLGVQNFLHLNSSSHPVNARTQPLPIVSRHKSATCWCKSCPASVWHLYFNKTPCVKMKTPCRQSFKGKQQLQHSFTTIYYANVSSLLAVYFKAH